MAKTVFSNTNRHKAKFIPSKEQTTDPSRLIDIKIKQLRNDFEGRAHRLKTSGIAVDAHNRILAGWQTEYDRAKGSLTDDKSRLKLASRMVRTGEMLPETARDVGRHTMGLPSAPRTRTERQPSAAGLSPSQQKSYTGYFAELAKQTVVNPWGWGKTQRKHADPDMLKEMFLNEWDIQNLDDPRNVNKRLGFIQSWKTAMSENRHTKKAWQTLSGKNGDPEVRMTLTPPSQLMDVFKRKVQGASPLGRSIASGLPKQPQQAPEPIRQHSQSRGKTRVSYDGGRTWQIE